MAIDKNVVSDSASWALNLDTHFDKNYFNELLSFCLKDVLEQG